MTKPSVRLATRDRIATDSVALGCFESSEPDAGGFSRGLSSAIRRCISQPGWKALDKQVVRAATGGRQPVMVAVHGLGPVKEFTAQKLAAWLGRVVSDADREGMKESTLVLPTHPSAAG